MNVKRKTPDQTYNIEYKYNINSLLKMYNILQQARSKHTFLKLVTLKTMNYATLDDIY